MLDATAIIDRARGLDGSFTPQVHPARILYEFLTRYQQELAGEILVREPEAISSEIEVSLPLPDFDAGAALETAPGVAVEYERIHDIALWDGQNEIKFWLFPFKHRFTPDRWPYGWLRENRLVLGGRETEYSGFTKIVLTYAPTPGTVDQDAPEMILPDNASNVVTLALGAEMAKRKPDLVERKTLPSEWAVAEQRFLEKIESRNDVEVGTVRRVFS